MGSSKDCEEKVDTEETVKDLSLWSLPRERETLFIMQTHYP